MTPAVRLGFVVNPIAGMGGRVGVHGTDGPALQLAVSRGAEPSSGLRASRALARVEALIPQLEIVTVGGPMGSDHLSAAQLGNACASMLTRPAGSTTAADTQDAVRHMITAGVDLVLFVGGDGTARDVVALTGTDIPVLGVPAGVKMHSGLFATSPEAAGETAARFLRDPEQVCAAEVEIVDLDESTGSPRLYGSARVPFARNALQRAKTSGPATDQAYLHGLGREIAEAMEPGRLYLLGPGTSVAHVGSALGVHTSVLGVDAILDRKVMCQDADESTIVALLQRYQAATLVLGVVGGQGFLLGRGNQQISAAVIAAVGAENVEILAAPGKIATLDPPVLRVDVGDESPLTPMLGYRRVRTGRGRSTVMNIIA